MTFFVRPEPVKFTLPLPPPTRSDYEPWTADNFLRLRMLEGYLRLADQASELARAADELSQKDLHLKLSVTAKNARATATALFESLVPSDNDLARSN